MAQERQYASRRDRSRSRSPRRETHHRRERIGHDDSRRRSSRNKNGNSLRLPYGASALTKHDLSAYQNLFATYLDVQKQIAIDELEERELRGRWKSFINKWNAGELSEGYYDPQTKARADARSADDIRNTQRSQPTEREASANSEGDSADGYGPSIPRGDIKSAGLPNRQDLQYRDELERDAREAARHDARYERKLDRKLQRDRMDELAPKAEAGTKERQLEKKREKADSNRAFRDAKSPGAEEVGERDLMGGDDSIEGYRAKLKAEEKRKTERELRREEVLRARAAEREERLAHHRAKEDKTIEMLRSLAQQRYG